MLSASQFVCWLLVGKKVSSLIDPAPSSCSCVRLAAAPTCGATGRCRIAAKAAAPGDAPRHAVGATCRVRFLDYPDAVLLTNHVFGDVRRLLQGSHAAVPIAAASAFCWRRENKKQNKKQKQRSQCLLQFPWSLAAVPLACCTLQWHTGCRKGPGPAPRGFRV